MAELGVNTEQAAPIPDRLYFRIGEVSRLVGVKPYVLRYWETEFPALAPKKSATGQRVYRRRDVELLLEIKRLLYDKRYTLEGARKHLKGAGRGAGGRPTRKSKQDSLFDSPPAGWEQIRKDLAEILNLLG
jgi:DNA-binding transcriptional MerR regulator